MPNLTKNGFYYHGIYNQPHPANKKTSIGYSVSKDKDVVVLYLMTPGFFNDAYRLASHVDIKRIFLAPMTLDFNFVSDVYRLATALKPLKTECTVIHPTIPDNYNNVNGFSFFNDIKKSLNYLINVNLEDSMHDIVVKFISNPSIIDGYDIFIQDGVKGRYLTNCVSDEEYIRQLIDKKEIEEIYIPYAPILYGGIGYEEIAALPEIKMDKIKICSVNNDFEAKYCIAHHKGHLSETEIFSIINTATFFPKE